MQLSWNSIRCWAWHSYQENSQIEILSFYHFLTWELTYRVWHFLCKDILDFAASINSNSFVHDGGMAARSGHYRLQTLRFRGEQSQWSEMYRNVSTTKDSPIWKKTGEQCVLHLGGEVAEWPGHIHLNPSEMEVAETRGRLFCKVAIAKGLRDLGRSCCGRIIHIQICS